MNKKIPFPIEVIIIAVVDVVLVGGAYLSCPKKPKPFPLIIEPSLSCKTMYYEIEKALEDANFCEQDSDCKTMDIGGMFVEFGCYKFVNKSTNEEKLYQRMGEYYKKCKPAINDCASSPESVCVDGKCVVKN